MPPPVSNGPRPARREAPPGASDIRWLAARFLLAATGLILLMAPLSNPQPASASDTLYHQMSTQESLSRLGFSQAAIDTVTVGEWYVDFYVNARLFGDVKKHVGQLHFDNLFSLAEVESNFQFLETISKRKLGEMGGQGQCDAFGILMLTGTVFHAIQDFYSHSNWAAKFPGEQAWDDWDAVPRDQRTEIQTGWYPHSKWAKFKGPPSGARTHDQMQQDYAGRPFFEDAQEQATKTKEAWANKFRQWLGNDACWEKVKSWPAAGDPQADLVTPSSLSGISPLRQEITQMEDISRAANHWDGPSSGWGIGSADIDKAGNRFVKGNFDPNVFDGKFQWILRQMGMKTAMADRTVILVVDASGSMGDPIPNDPSGRRKIDGAKDAVVQMLNGLSPSSEAAIVAYFSCSDVRVQPPTMDKQALIDSVIALEPSGDTDMFGSIEAARVLVKYGLVSSPDVEGILLSDGQHNCSGDPIEAAETWHQEPISLPQPGAPIPYQAALVPGETDDGAAVFAAGQGPIGDYPIPATAASTPVLHTIGFGVDVQAEEQLKLVAAAGGGRYYSADSAGELATALRRASRVSSEASDTLVVILLSAVLAIVGGAGIVTWLTVATRRHAPATTPVALPAAAPTMVPAGRVEPTPASVPPGGPMLKVVRGEASAPAIALTGPVTRVGSSSANQLVISSGDISRHHCEIRREGQDFVLYNRDYATGTLVNGAQVTRHVLHEGDTVQVGETVLVFHVDRHE
jgi:hypothetical protein